jgi:predicted MFS family arabinose efflux permease
LNANILYPAGRLLLAISFALLAIQSNIPGFIVFFALVYLFLGISNTPESVLMNELIPSRYRASILSLNSFILQLGALGTSVFSAKFLAEGKISTLWLSASLILGITCILFVFLLRKKKNPRIASDTGIERTSR